MVLRSQPAYISLTARRAQPAGPPPTQPTTTPNHQPHMREINDPHLTTVFPYQIEKQKPAWGLAALLAEPAP
jgi:hypothetical protein